MQKINPYVIIIIVLLLFVAGFTYDKWGKDFLPASTENPDEQSPGGDSIIDTGSFEGDIQIGDKDAPVTIIEYFSYFCGYCKLFHDETYPRILEDYVTTGKVKFVLRPYPPYELGTAVLCADDQGKFLEYHESLFKNSQTIQEIDDLKSLASDLGLNGDQFGQCFDSQKYLVKAQEWYQQGDQDFENAGVPENQRGTPSFVINGELLIGAQPYEKFVELIEKGLSE